MIRVILRVFLLMTLNVTAGLSTVSHAQQLTNVLTGEWVGKIGPPGRSEFARLSLTENAGEMRRPLKAKSTLVQLEGAPVKALRKIWRLRSRFYPNGSHTLWRFRLMEVPPENPTSGSASNDSHGFVRNDVDWTTTRLRRSGMRRVSVPGAKSQRLGSQNQS